MLLLRRAAGRPDPTRLMESGLTCRGLRAVERVDDHEVEHDSEWDNGEVVELSEQDGVKALLPKRGRHESALPGSMTTALTGLGRLSDFFRGRATALPRLEFCETG